MKPVCYTLIFEKDGVVKKYIGCTLDFKKRIMRHLRELSKNVHHNSHLQSLYNSGWRWVGQEIVETNSFSEAYALEQSLISESLDDDSVVNIGVGYDNITHNPKRDKILSSIRSSCDEYLKTLSDEDRKIKYGKSGESNGMYKRTHSERTRNIIREKLRIFYDTHGSPLVGVKKSDEHRAKMSAIASARTGVKNPFFGKTHTKETRQKIAESSTGRLPSNSRKVIIDGIFYRSLTEAARSLNLHTTVVLWRVKSKNPKFSRWNWL